VDLSSLVGHTVVYGYPRTGRPDQDPPTSRNAIPGVRGARRNRAGFGIITKTCSG
jgi:hypothetical protein